MHKLTIFTVCMDLFSPVIVPFYANAPAGPDWNKFEWTDEIFLGRIKSGIYSFRFYTKGQDYGVADLDKFEIYQPK